MANSKYTYSYCIQDSAKYETLKEWRLGSSATYKAAHRLGWLEDCVSQLTKTMHTWTKEECLSIARSFKERKEWRSTREGEKAYQAAHRNGWLEECTAHMSPVTTGKAHINWSSVDFIYDIDRNSREQSKITAGSHYDAWWICPKDLTHHFQKSVRSVVRGWHCPYCNEELLDGKNSLKDLGADLLCQWDYTKNRTLKPTDITRKFSSAVWWICNKNHSWKESPKNRYNNGLSCRKCTSIKARARSNETRIAMRGSLLDKLPEISDYWSETNTKGPADYSAGSNETVWLLRPSDGLLASSTPKTLTKNPDSLHKEVGIIRKVTSTPLRADSFAALHPGLMREWSETNDADPYNLAEFSAYEANWVCGNCSYKWKASLAGRSSGRGCRKCGSKSGARARVENKIALFGSVADHFPALVNEWHPIKNSNATLAELTVKSSHKGWWKCSYGHEWSALISNRTGGSSCPICAGRGSKWELRVWSELEYFFNDIIWQYKDDCGEVDLYIPEIKTGIEVDGYPWHEGKGDKDQNKTDRYYEKGIRVIRLRDSRLTEVVSDSISFPNIPGDHGLYEAIIQLVKMTVTPCNLRDTYLSTGTFVCVNRYNELIAQYPRPPKGRSVIDVIPSNLLAWNYARNSPITPEMVYAGSNVLFWFICPTHGDYETTPAIRKRGSGCPLCGYARSGNAKRKPSTSEKALSTHLLSMAIKPSSDTLIDASQISINSHLKIDWVCPNNHVWRKVIREMVQRPICPTCQLYENSLSVKAPYQSTLWNEEKNGMAATQIRAGSRKIFHWKCPDCEHEWMDSPGRMARNCRKKCPSCHNATGC